MNQTIEEIQEFVREDQAGFLDRFEKLREAFKKKPAAGGEVHAELMDFTRQHFEKLFGLIDQMTKDSESKIKKLCLTLGPRTKRWASCSKYWPKQ